MIGIIRKNLKIEFIIIIVMYYLFIYINLSLHFNHKYFKKKLVKNKLY